MILVENGVIELGRNLHQRYKCYGYRLCPEYRKSKQQEIKCPKIRRLSAA